MRNVSSIGSPVLLRENVDIYRNQYGIWKLTWKPSEVFSQSRNRIYSNGEAGIYKAS